MVIKSFIHSIKRFKVSSIINILGLTVAFATFIVIAILINYENSFDTYHSNHKNIYRVDNANRKTGNVFSVLHPRAMTESVINFSPHITAGTLFTPPYGETQMSMFSKKAGTQVGVKEEIIFCQPAITDIFDFKIVEGDIDCLHSPEYVLLPQSMAKRFFGDESALEQQFTLAGSHWLKPNQTHLIVGGVFKDFPENTQLHNTIYTAIGKNTYIEDWRSSNYLCYILLDDAASPEDIAANYNKQVDIDNEDEYNIGIKLTPLTDIYYMNEFDNSKYVKGGDSTNSLLLLTIAISVIIIAVINFINFSMALAPLRLRAVATRKIFGCRDSTLQLEIIGEAILTTLIAFVLAVLLVQLVSSNNLLPFIKVNINPLDNTGVVALSLLVAIVAGFIAGIRPALYVGSFPPILAVQGSAAITPRGKKLRLFLVGFQFTISLVLIISTLFIYQQNRFIRDFKVGYDTEQVIVVSLNEYTIRENMGAYTSRLKENSDVIDVAFGTEKFGASSQYRTWGVNFNDHIISFNSIGVSSNFPEMMNIEPIDGRTFLEDEGGSGSCLINKGVSETHNIEVGDFLTVSFAEPPIQVIGIIDDVKFTSLHSKNRDRNLMLIGDRYNRKPVAYVKVKPGADYAEVIRHIQEVVSVLDPLYLVDIEFYDQLFGELYVKENDIAKNIFMFSLIAILISIMGVFGLVLLENQYRRKEIGIRRVFGSSELQILKLFNRGYMQIFTVSLIFAIPLVVIIINHWLNNFAYKIPLYWWIFLLGAIPILLLIVITVTIQSYKAAIANPVESIESN